MNTSLAKCLGQTVNLHIFTLAQNPANTFLLWDRLSICGIVNPPNTHRLQSLFEVLSIKETINYEHRNWKPNMQCPVLKNSPCVCMCVCVCVYVCVCIYIFIHTVGVP